MRVRGRRTAVPDTRFCRGRRVVRYFGNSLELLKNHPRIIPEVYPLAHLAMAHYWSFTRTWRWASARS